MALEVFATTPNQGISTLTGPISNSATTITVASMAALKLDGLTGSDFAYCKITDVNNWRQHPINRKETFEIIKVTAISGDDLTAVRGVDGTSGTVFAANDIVEVVFCNIHYQHLVNAITDGTKELAVGKLKVGVAGVPRGTSVVESFGDISVGGTSTIVLDTDVVATLGFLSNDISGGPPTDDMVAAFKAIAEGNFGSNNFRAGIGFFPSNGSVLTEHMRLGITGKLTIFTGDLEITAGDTTLGGDLIFVGAGSGKPYGSMYMFEGGETLTIDTSSQWEELTAGLSAGSNNLTTFANSHETKADIAGEWEFDWSASVMTGTAQQEVMGTLTINGADAGDTVGAESTFAKSLANHQTIVAANKAVSLSGHGTGTLALDDVVSFVFSNESGTTDIVVCHITFKMAQAGG